MGHTRGLHIDIVASPPGNNRLVLADAGIPRNAAGAPSLQTGDAAIPENATRGETALACLLLRAGDTPR